MGNHGGLLRGGVTSAVTPMREGAGQAKMGGRLMTEDVTGAQRGEGLAHGPSHGRPQGVAPSAVSVRP